VNRQLPTLFTPARTQSSVHQVALCYDSLIGLDSADSPSSFVDHDTIIQIQSSLHPPKIPPCNDVLPLWLDHLSTSHPPTPPVIRHIWPGPTHHLTPCIIISDGWPSWLFSCSYHYLVCHSVFLPSLDHAWLPHISAAYPSCQWYEITTNNLLEHIPMHTAIVLVQGSFYVSPEDLPQILFNYRILWSLPPSHGPFTSAGGHQFSSTHFNAGGVIAGCWSFWSTHPFAASPTTPCYQRRLRHIISPATPGGKHLPGQLIQEADSTLDSPVQWCQEGVLDWNGGLPLRTPCALVRCKSVFSPTGWVTRPLSAKELRAAFDVPQCIPIVALEGSPFMHLSATPTKLLTAALQHWELTKVRDKESPGQRQVDSRLTCMGETIQLPNRVFLPPVSEPQQDIGKATKDDAAETQVSLWNDRVWRLGVHTQTTYDRFQQFMSRNSCPSRIRMFCPLDSIRSFLLCYWRRRVTSSLLQYLRSTHGKNWSTAPAGEFEREVGRECLGRVAGASWWEWSAGSTLFFWRWAPSLRDMALYGHPVWTLKPLPKFTQPQPRAKDESVCSKVAAKLSNVREKRYVCSGEVRSLTGYFCVPKGPTDIRMVYDATKSGLNDCLWVPAFPLPSAEAFTDQLETRTWMMDLDLGEMFLNFPLDISLRPYCGIDLRPYFPTAGNKTHWERWVRCMMGLRSSPYCTTKALFLAYEMVMGDRFQENNPLNWMAVRLNLPGSSSYNPSLPWVHRI
jgi:hypothetical protein